MASTTDLLAFHILHVEQTFSGPMALTAIGSFRPATREARVHYAHLMIFWKHPGLFLSAQKGVGLVVFALAQRVDHHGQLEALLTDLYAQGNRHASDLITLICDEPPPLLMFSFPSVRCLK